MNVIEWAASAEGRAAASAATAAVIVLTMAVSAQLRRRNRRSAVYRLLLAGLAMALPPAAGFASGAGGAAAAADWLRLSSFLIINFAVLELYTFPRKRDRLTLVLFLLGAAGAVAAQWSLGGYEPPSATADGAGGVVLRPSSLAAVVLCGLLPAYILPRIGQKGKYAASLAVFFLHELIRSPGSGAGGWLSALAAWLPTGYFAVLFLLLFGRVVERMQSVYVSSIRDGLTGLYNRRHFLRKANRYVARGLRVSVLFCDIDNFKALNDTRGHQAADEALKQVSAVIAAETAGSGTAGRYGGEELVAAIARPGIKPGEIAETIRRRVEEETAVTLSIGWSAVRDGMAVEEALKEADEAMYKSKTTGKNKVTAYRPPRSASSS